MDKRTCLLMLAATLALGACERAPQTAAPAPVAPAQADSQDPTRGLAPPLVVPGENTETPQTPSYEVAIASAAADHNNSLERCTQQPEAVRTQCEQEANAAFVEAQQNLEPLRGNQE